MSYSPREGVDYIIDLYSVVGVPPTAEEETIKAAITQRTIEYHPDPQQTRAPEFQAKATRMMNLINRARGILLDQEKRATYNQIMQEWDGPVSTDGTPIVRFSRMLQGELIGKTADEVESELAARQERSDALSGHSPSRLALFERLIADRDDDAPEDLRQEYEAALLAQDTSLAIQEADRLQLLGVKISEECNYSIGYDHGDKVVAEIAAARDQQQKELQALAIGGFSTRLAILAGESEPTAPPPNTALVPAASLELPPYFEPQAARVADIAREREAVLLKRLARLEPIYPEEELQTTLQDRFFIGIDSGENTIWLDMRHNPNTNSADNVTADPELIARLQAGDFAPVIAQGYNVFRFGALEQMEPLTMIENVIVKHLNRFPDRLPAPAETPPQSFPM